MNKNLTWNVFIEDLNKKSIITYNVLNKGIVNEIVDRTEGFASREDFAEEVKHILMYYYWSRAEWEVVITDWPPHIKPEELNRLNNELVEHKSKGYNAYSFTFNPAIGRKIDVWDQVNMNWDIFIDYVCNNLFRGGNT